jgi:hypothetical protein
MRKLVVCILYLFFVQVNFAQDTNVERLAKAETELKEALAKEDYEKAAALKKEIQLRQEIEAAVKIGDYEKAAQLKGELQNLGTNQETKGLTDNQAEHAYPKPSNNKAIVEFVRVTANGWNAEIRLFNNRNYLGSCWGVSHMRYEFDPGEHFFWIYFDVHEAFLKANLEANKIYVVYIDLDGSGVFLNLGLSPISPSDAALIERAKRVIYKHPVKVTSPNDIAKVQDKLEKNGFIDKIFKKYEKKYKDTDKTTRLESNMDIPWSRMQP